VTIKTTTQNKELIDFCSDNPKFYSQVKFWAFQIKTICFFRYFRGGGGELPVEMLEGGSESLKKSKIKKKKSSGKDWTWKDQVDMVKWTDRMINVSLRQLSFSKITF
jgi:hypothetical protein